MVKMASLNWRHLTIFMIIYVLGSQIAWHFSLVIYADVRFSVFDPEFKNESFTVKFSLYTNMPLDIKVVLMPITEKPSNLSIYVFYDPKYPTLGTSWERIHMLRSNLRRELSLRGFKKDVQLITAKQLESLLDEKKRAIVIVASGAFPANVFSRDKDLVKPWLDAGGILIWFGWPPGFYTVYENQIENETFCQLPQHLHEEGVKRLGLKENILGEDIKVKSYEGFETAEKPSYLGKILDINYNLINYGALNDSLSGNGLALGMIGGNPPRTSVSMIPIGKGKIILFGFFVLGSYMLNGPELSARDIAQIIRSGVIYSTKDSPPACKEYHLLGGRTITDKVEVKIKSNIEGVAVYVYPTLSSTCLLYFYKFYEQPSSK